jgi:Tol biopolymer transport system component
LLLTASTDSIAGDSAMMLWHPDGRGDELTPDPAAHDPVISPDGRSVAFALGEGPFSDTTAWEKSRVAIASVQTREVRLLSANIPSTPVLSLQWSADGSEVAFLRYGNDSREIAAVSVEDGEERRLLDITDFEPSGPFSWSSDGRELLVPTSPDPDLPSLSGPPWRYPDELRRYSVETGEYVTVENAHTTIWDVAWSPDGRLVAMETDSPGTDRIRLWVLDLATGESVPVDRRRGGLVSISWSGPYLFYTYFVWTPDDELKLMRWDSTSQERVRITGPDLERLGGYDVTVSVPRFLS